MSWGILFRVSQSLKGSLWAIPLTGALLGVLLGFGGIALDQHVDVPSYWQYTPSTATSVLAAIVGASAALAGFVVTVSVLVVQIAVDSLSSRYMRIWFRDRMLKLSLAVLLGTLTFSLQELRRVNSTFVPNLGVSVAGIFLVVGLILFLLFLDRSLHRVRPVAVAALIAKHIRRTIEAAIRTAASPDAPDFALGQHIDEPPERVVRSAKAGVLQAIDGAGLVRLARANDCLVVVVPTVGDFVSIGAPLFELHGAETTSRSLERRLQGMMALGNERTIEQDPAFGIRIMVDIANMALSPAVNDPTTAVQVIDHLGETLRVIGTADVVTVTRHGSRAERPYVIVPTRSWEDFVALALTEIREYGARSVQVTRRLRAMLESVRDSVPSERRAAIDEELARLDASTAQAFADSVDLDRASDADQQGLGGHHHSRAAI